MVNQGKKIPLPDGNIAIFAGKKKSDYCIIIKDEKEKVHLNFVLKPDEYELHLKNEVTREKNHFLKDIHQ